MRLSQVFTTDDRGRQRQPQVDPFLLWSALALLILGLVMVYSASVPIAEASKSTGFQPAYYLIRQAVFLSVGLVVGFFVFQIPTKTTQKMAPPLFVVGVLLLILVLIPHVGRVVNGSQRWISLGLFNFQPSELMKLLTVLYAADYTTRKLAVMDSLRRGFLPMASVIILIGFLLLREPDFGALVVISAIAFGVLFLGGINIRLFILLSFVAVIGFVLLVWLSPYRRERILGFMDPWQDAFGKGYQLSHALIAFGRGEFFGVGLGASVEKLFYLPEAHTDFLLAVIAEELGFMGVLCVLVLFAILIQRCFAIGREAVQMDRPYAALVAQGIGIWLGVQAFINMGVNMGILPTKGLTLPLMSFGGSGIVVNCMALALLLRIDYENRSVKGRIR
jgi:cell division protein FtsW